jgi:putative transposase
MARARRPYLPGAFFHLTARTQDKVHRFTNDNTKDIIAGYIADAVDACDVDLIAYAIMDNHLHLIIRQQRDPLARLMQPILRRCALLVQRSFDVDGHVFGRKFRHRVCRTGEELRYCIGYVHRNPLKAGSCDDPAHYRWCSHAAYARAATLACSQFRSPKLLIPRELYARGKRGHVDQLCDDYLTYLAEMEAAAVAGGSRTAFPIHGDLHWAELCSVAHLDRDEPSRNPRMDLRDVVQAGIRQLCPELDISLIRAFRGGRITAIRKELIERASLAGYRGCEIARYLHVSESTVSKILKRQRLRQKHGKRAA